MMDEINNNQDNRYPPMQSHPQQQGYSPYSQYPQYQQLQYQKSLQSLQPQLAPVVQKSEYATFIFIPLVSFVGIFVWLFLMVEKFTSRQANESLKNLIVVMILPTLVFVLMEHYFLLQLVMVIFGSLIAPF